MKVFQKLWDFKFIILLAIVVVIFLALYVDFSKVNPFREKKYYTIDDTCGLLPGGQGIIHTVNNEEECDVQCYGKCESDGLKKVKSVFLKADVGCHDCSCVCR